MRKPLITSGILITIVFIILWAGFSPDRGVEAQTEGSSLFRIGERLTYSISFDKFQNVAYAETYVVSKGRFNGQAAIEIQSKLKTLNFVTVGVMLLDTQRTVLVSPIDGSVLFVKNVDKSAGSPSETSTNVAERAPGSFDLSSIIYKIRSASGSGSFTMFENEKVYNVSFQTVGSETVRCDAGEFSTNVIEAKSDYFAEFGITGLRISISTEESSIPVQFRVRTARGEFRAVIASIQLDTPNPTPAPGSTPSNVARPTPKPSSTPAPYVDNQPLNGMPFELGETLAYSVASGPRQLGTVVLSAKERVLVNKKDSLVLTATVINENGGLFRVGNGIRSSVDPETLSPFDLSVHFDGPLASINKSVRFDPASSKVILPSGEAIDVPVGTQNVLSLIYAIRLFNLTLSKDTTNPVNDTRVAVYWEGKSASIFTLKPSDQAVLTIGNAKVRAQPISVTTRIPALDALEIKIWLSVDERRVPLRIVVGNYRLDLQIPNAVPQP